MSLKPILTTINFFISTFFILLTLLIPSFLSISIDAAGLYPIGESVVAVVPYEEYRSSTIYRSVPVPSIYLWSEACGKRVPEKSILQGTVGKVIAEAINCPISELYPEYTIFYQVDFGGENKTTYMNANSLVSKDALGKPGAGEIYSYVKIIEPEITESPSPTPAPTSDPNPENKEITNTNPSSIGNIPENSAPETVDTKISESTISQPTPDEPKKAEIQPAPAPSTQESDKKLSTEQIGLIIISIVVVLGIIIFISIKFYQNKKKPKD